jgi:tetratricopeptide (TPR) repeat protein
VSVWALPLLVLGVGLVAGLVLVILTRGGGRQDRRAELRAKKDSLIDQLRSLRTNRAKLDAAEFQRRWDQLLDEAAGVLRDMEQAQEDPEIGAVPVDGAQRSRFSWAMVLLGLGFFAVLGAGLSQYAAPRLEGGSLTGTDLSGAIARQAQLDAAEAALVDNPDDLDALNLLTYSALQSGDLGAAMKWMDRCRKVDADHPEVRTHLAILQLSIGMGDKAVVELDAALEAEPALSKALFWRGLAALRSGERELAAGFLERALEAASTPEEREQASQGLMEARRPPAQVMLRGKLSLAEGVAMPGKGVLFIMVRRSEDGAGPPVAAVRLDPRGVPGSFSVTDRDLMMGGAWPDSVWVEARVDTDGDPMTKSPADLLAARVGPFAPKSTAVELELGGGAEHQSSGVEQSSHVAAAVSGTISVAQGTRLPKSGAVFLIVRRSPTPQGPPAAAVRLAPSDVPGTFFVGEENLMLGGPWPAQAWLQVRADADGNAMTRSDEDVSSPVVGPIAEGTTDVTLLLGG